MTTRRLPVLAEIEHVMIREALDLLKQRYEMLVAEGKREGMANREIETRLEILDGVDDDSDAAFAGLLERIGDVPPEFASRISKAWRSVDDPVPIAGAQQGETIIGPGPGHETTILGM